MKSKKIGYCNIEDVKGNQISLHQLLQQLNQPKESESVDNAKQFLDNKSTYGICKEDGDYIHKDCVIALLTEYANQQPKEESLEVEGFLKSKGIDLEESKKRDGYIKIDYRVLKMYFEEYATQQSKEVSKRDKTICLMCRGKKEDNNHNACEDCGGLPM